MSIQKVDKQTGNISLICGSTNFSDSPIGTIFATMSATAPVGFLLCDGTAYRKADYPELWEILPSTVKDTTNNTFTIDLREVALKGAGLTGKTVGAHLDADGLAVGEFLDDQLQAHTHSNKTGTTTAGQVAWTMFATNQLGTATEQTNNGAVGRFGATTEVKSVGVNYIIKAKMVALPADFMAKVDEAVEEAIGEWETVPITQVVTSGRSWVEVKCAKKGDLVTLSGIISLSAYSEANVIATGFPIPKAPTLTTNGTYIIVPSFVGSDSGGTNVRIDKNGNLIMYNADSAGNVYFGTTYALI